jgi:cytochrome bd ubiquinol oxidase subunit I
VTFGIIVVLYAALGTALVVVLRTMSRRWREEGDRESEVPYGPEPEVPADVPEEVTR